MLHEIAWHVIGVGTARRPSFPSVNSVAKLLQWRSVSRHNTVHPQLSSLPPSAQTLALQTDHQML